MTNLGTRAWKTTCRWLKRNQKAKKHRKQSWPDWTPRRRPRRSRRWNWKTRQGIPGRYRTRSHPPCTPARRETLPGRRRPVGFPGRTRPHSPTSCCHRPQHNRPRGMPYPPPRSSCASWVARCGPTGGMVRAPREYSLSACAWSVLRATRACPGHAGDPLRKQVVSSSVNFGPNARELLVPPASFMAGKLAQCRPGGSVHGTTAANHARTHPSHGTTLPPHGGTAPAPAGARLRSASGA